MAVVAAVADAVVTELNAAAFSLPFTAVRKYQPHYDLAQLKSLHVTVIPSGLMTQQAARGPGQRDVDVDIAVQQKLTQEENADLDPLLALAEEIAEHFRGKRLSAHPQAIWVKTEHKAVFVPEHLQQYRQFTSVLTLTFRVLE